MGGGALRAAGLRMSALGMGSAARAAPPTTVNKAPMVAPFAIVRPSFMRANPP